MKLHYVFVGLVALSGVTLQAGIVSAMPIARLPQSLPANVERVVLACGPNGCVRAAPAAGYGIKRYGPRGAYAFNRVGRRR